MDSFISSPQLENLAEAFRGMTPEIQNQIRDLAAKIQTLINDKLREQPAQASGVNYRRTGTEQSGWIDGFSGDFGGFDTASTQLTWSNAVAYSPFLQDQDFQRLDGGFAVWVGHTAQEIIEASQGEIDELAHQTADDIVDKLATAAGGGL